MNEPIQHADNIVIYPNPFKEEARFSFSLNKNEQVGLSVMDLLGKETVIFPSQIFATGEHHLTLKASDLNLSKGIYFLRFTQGDKVTVKKIILN